MAKSTRKKKEKAKDFVKPKLKVGKKLAKSDNLTDTSFKTRSIVLQTQLEDKGSQATTHRGLTLKVLLRQLQHHNPNVRADAVRGVIYLLEHHPTDVNDELPRVIQHSTALMSDMERPVRRALVALLRRIVADVATSHLLPLMSLVAAQLSAAQTHIDENIRSDSLLVLDVFLDADAALLGSHAHGVLADLVTLAAQQHALLFRGDIQSASHRSAKKDALQNGRVQLLQRVYRLLEMLLTQKNCRGGGVNEEEEDAGEVDVRVTRNVAIYKHSGNGKPNPLLPVLFVGDTLLRGSTEQSMLDETLKSLHQVLTRLLPILADFWTECDPGQLVAGLSDNMVPQATMECMQLISGCCCSLWQLVQQQLQEEFFTVFHAQEADRLRGAAVGCLASSLRLRTCFPLPECVGGVDNIRQLNLCLARLFVAMRDVVASSASPSIVQNLRTVCKEAWEYAVTLLTFQGCVTGGPSHRHSAPLSPNVVSELLTTISSLTVNASMETSQMEQECVTDMFKGLCMLMTSRSPQSVIYFQLLLFVYKHILRQSDRGRDCWMQLLERSPGFEDSLTRWLHSLPTVLQNLQGERLQTSRLLLEVLHCAASRRLSSATSSLGAAMVPLFTNHDGAFLSWPPKLQRLASCVLFYLDSVPQELLASVTALFHLHLIGADEAAYLFGMLEMRSPLSSVSHQYGLVAACDRLDWIDFLLSTLFGCPDDVIVQLQSAAIQSVSSSHSLPFYRAPSHTLTSPLVRRDNAVQLEFSAGEDVESLCHWRQRAVESVCSALCNVTWSSQLWLVLDRVFAKLLENLKVIPVDLACAMLSASARLSYLCRPRGHLPAIVQPDLSELVLTTIGYFCHHSGGDVTNLMTGSWSLSEHVWRCSVDMLASAPCLLQRVTANITRLLSGSLSSNMAVLLARVVLAVVHCEELLEVVNENQAAMKQLVTTLVQHSSLQAHNIERGRLSYAMSLIRKGQGHCT